MIARQIPTRTYSGEEERLARSPRMSYSVTPVEQPTAPLAGAKSLSIDKHV